MIAQTNDNHTDQRGGEGVDGGGWVKGGELLFFSLDLCLISLYNFYLNAYSIISHSFDAVGCACQINGKLLSWS